MHLRSMEVVKPYTYDLPKDRIAQRPVHPRDSAKLLVCGGEDLPLQSLTFKSLPNFLTKDDLLVFNNTKVIPARINGQISTGAVVEVLLIKKIGDDWQALCRPARKFTLNGEVNFSDAIKAQITSKDGKYVGLRFYNGSNLALDSEVFALGRMPIPPYIRKGLSDLQDSEDYQTIFAKELGSIAAPTASLHFNDELMQKINQLGCQVANVTLHVGTASFFSLEPNEKPGNEEVVVSSETYSKIEETKKNGGSVIAVGTTVARALEGAKSRELFDKSFQCELFITPGYDFKVLDGLITNFHMPSTTHLLLVEALIGRKSLTDIYNYALSNDYRFLSYGDGMFLVGQN